MWKITYQDTALKTLGKLGYTAQRAVFRYMQERIATSPDPRYFGKPLRHEFQGYWRYRVGDYRIICEIKENELVVLVIDVDHRKDVYE